MKLSVLIPYRADSPQRERIYNYTSRLWKGLGTEVIYSGDGYPNGLFSFSKAINRARTQATGDAFLSYSVDALPPTRMTIERLEAMLGTYPWVAGWRGQSRFTEAQTERLLSGTGPSLVGNPQGGICIGREALVAVRADVWDSLKGYDERFLGWGPEDKAWHYALKATHPKGWDKNTEDLFHTLWHPSTPRTMLKANIDLFKQYRAQPTKDFRAWYLSR